MKFYFQLMAMWLSFLAATVLTMCALAVLINFFIRYFDL